MFETARDSLKAELQETLMLLPAFKADGGFSKAAATAVLDREVEEARKRLRRLAGRSLVKEVREGRWEVHPLVIEFAQTRGGVDDGVWGRMARHYVEVLVTADNLYLQGGQGVLAGLALFDLERGHIETGQGWTAARLCSAYPDAGAYVVDLRLHAHTQIGWLEAAVGAAGRLGDREAGGSHLGNLGTAYWNLGETRRASEYYEQALAIAREIGDKRNEGAHLGSLGNAYAGLGETRRVREYLTQAVRIFEEIEDPRAEQVQRRPAPLAAEG